MPKFFVTMPLFPGSDIDMIQQIEAKDADHAYRIAQNVLNTMGGDHDDSDNEDVITVVKADA